MAYRQPYSSNWGWTGFCQPQGQKLTQTRTGSVPCDCQGWGATKGTSERASIAQGVVDEIWLDLGLLNQCICNLHVQCSVYFHAQTIMQLMNHRFDRRKNPNTPKLEPHPCQDKDGADSGISCLYLCHMK